MKDQQNGFVGRSLRPLKFIIFFIAGVLAGPCALAQRSVSQEAKADTLLRHQDFEGALKLYSKILKGEKADLKTSYKQALCYYGLKDYTNALKDLERVILEDPNLFQAYLLRAFIYKEQNDLPHMIEDLSAVLRLQPGNVDVVKWRASTYLDEEEFEAAKNDLLYAKTLQDDAEVEMYLGVAYYSLNRTDSAFHCLNNAMGLDVTFLPTYLYACSFSLQESDFNLALKYSENALKLDPTNANALLYKGIALAELKKVDEGCRYLKKALDGGEDDAADYLKEFCYGAED
jgi:tetratricopeptide (TPR) repeat protein